MLGCCGNEPNMTLQRPRWQNVAERIIALVVLLLIVPLLSMIAPMVKMTSPGPCLSQLERVGLEGRQFWLYRFRATSGGSLTSVGRVLRRYALDGLPQLWNVITGDLRLLDIEGLQTR